jgi:hypothetical protein
LELKEQGALSPTPEVACPVVGEFTAKEYWSLWETEVTLLTVVETLVETY